MSQNTTENETQDISTATARCYCYQQHQPRVSSQAWALGHSGHAARRPFRWPELLTPDGRGIGFGGDYNPDQWPEEVWDDDIRLMKKAHVNTVALAIFSWDRIEPYEGVFDFGWLDRIITKLGTNGIATDLATATAAAPLWLYKAHPEVLPVEKDGSIINPGSRQSWRPTSPVFREYALTLCRAIAEHYKNNPYVIAWHINNEYGWNNSHDYSDDAERAFQQWCKNRYHTIDALNTAWGTAFWAQEVRSFDDVILPRHMGNDAMANPSHQLDYERFCSDALKEFYIAERTAVERICPGKPFTTNFMIAAGQCELDYADWSDEVDFVSNDHYFTPGEAHLDELACSDSLVNGLSLGNPWYLMEHSTSSVQWKPVNARKRSGELIRDAVAHVAMGADAINFFQWRQSRSGAEKFHSAMLPHAGENSQIFQDVCELGRILDSLSAAGLQGSRVSRSQTAILFDVDCEWASRCGTLPSSQISHWDDVCTWYRAFLDVSARADVVPLRGDWSGYGTVVLPAMLVLSDREAERLKSFVRAGGRVIIGYASGLADGNFRVALGGYPGVLRDVAGVRSEEFNIIGDLPGEPAKIMLSDGSASRLWQNVVTSVGPDAQTLAVYEGEAAADWEVEGLPAVVRNRYGDGTAYYIGCDLDQADISQFLRKELGMCSGFPGLSGYAGDRCGSDGSPAEVVHIRRECDTADFDFYFNRSKDAVSLSDVAGEQIMIYRESSGSIGEGLSQDICRKYTLERNGFLVTKTGHTVGEGNS